MNSSGTKPRTTHRIATLLNLVLVLACSRAVATTTVTTGQHTVEVGQPVEVVVSVECADDLVAFQVRVHYGADLLELVYDEQSGEVGTGVTWTGRASGAFAHALTDDGGTLFCGVTRLTEWPPATAVTAGSGELFRFSLRGTAPGTVGLTYPQVTAKIADEAFSDDTTVTDAGTAQVVVYTQPSAVQFSPVAGAYSTAQTLTLTSENSTAIYTTLNGTDPDDTSTLYQAGLLQVDGAHGASVTVKAIGYNDFGQNSGVSTAVYSFDKVAPNADVLTPTTASPTNSATVSFSVHFDESVVGFDSVDDLDVQATGTAGYTGATVTVASRGLSASRGDDSYTVDLTGVTGEGALALAIATGSDVRDPAGNDLATSVTSAAVTVDRVAPTATLVWSSPTVLTVSYSESVTGAASAANYTLSPALEVTGVTQDGDDYRLTTPIQTPGTTYTVTSFGGTVDALGHGVSNTPQVVSGDFFTLGITDGSDSTRLALGEIAGATDGFDDGTDILLGSRSSSRGFSVYLRNPPVSTSGDPLQMLVDMRGTGATTTRWRLVVDVGTTRTPVDLSWDVSTAAGSREVYLQRVVSERPVGGGASDLKQATQPLTVTEDGEFELVYSALRSPSFTLSLSSGWTFAGIPVTTLQSAASVLVDGSARSLSADDILYWSDGVLSAASAAEPLRTEWGVWIYSPVAGQTQAIDGVTADGAILLEPGWSGMTPVTTVSMSSDARLSGKVWAWQPALQAYRRLRDDESLEPGNGYLIYVEGQGFLLQTGE